jgi:anthranilate synthase/aminodeoxychorismate synthase-like glutamine amidotransferase
MLLLIDNYDSFVHNLARYFRRLDQETEVVRNDAIDVAAIRRLQPQAIVLSPGPCTPVEAGNSLKIVRELHTELPMLGICLGHQTIAAALGARVVRAKTPMHGRTSLVWHQQTPLFRQTPSPFHVCRYHSLVVEPQSLPVALQATAETDEGIVMALEHTEHPVFGVQFHPEAALTEYGFQMLENFLCLAGLRCTNNIDELAFSEVLETPKNETPLPQLPVTF